MEIGNRISRKEFLKKTSLGICALSATGLSTLSAKEKQNSDIIHANRWRLSWQPERPRRLSAVTHQLAQRGLSGEFGRSLVKADWSFPEAQDTSLSPSQKYALAAMSVALNVPLRILPGELIVGSATILESAQHRTPLLDIDSTSHTTIGFGKALKTGYKGMRTEINERLSRGGLDAHGVDLLHSMLKTLDAAAVWQQRNIELLEQQMKEAPPEEQVTYQTLIHTLKQVPENKPRNFREALQSLWSMYAFQRLMGNWSGIGRMDQMLYPYLKKDLKEGKITLDEARERIAHFWIKGTEWIGVPNPTGDAQFYQNVILGGTDRDGNEVANEVTYLILDVIEELHISDYPVAVRLGKHTPEKLFRRIAEVQRFGGGIVSVYNEDVVIDGLIKFGYPEEEAREFTNDGCWEAIIPGKTAFIYWPFDMMQSFFRALHLDKEQETPVEYAGFESLYNAFVSELDKELTDMHHVLDGAYNNSHNAAPLISMFVEGCIEKGKGYHERGPKYSVNGIHAGGVTDVANSLLVLKKLVYEEQYIGLNDFVKILRNNWEMNEGMRRLIQDRFAFYGNDDRESDAMMCKVYDDYTALMAKVKEQNGVLRPCGISTFGREVDWRMMRKANPAGGRTGDILATNCSPSPGTDKKGPTAVLNSYCKMDFTKCCNGATVELKILPESVKGENGIRALVALAKVFREKKGFYMHVDVVDAATLIDAQMYPEKYPNLPVRVAGWSARFTTLCKEWQDMIIQRTQQVV
jgi:formate C-acetyltransferase